MGEVWKARDTRLNRIVAVKRLKEEHRKRFEHEARSIAAPNHPQQRISVHGWIYAIDNSLLRDLGVSITRPAEAPQQYAAAVRSLAVQQAAEKRLL